MQKYRLFCPVQPQRYLPLLYTILFAVTSYTTIAAYPLQTSSMVERFNRKLADMLFKHVNRTHTNWDLVQSLVTLANNSAAHGITGFSPYRLLYGRDSSTRLDAMLPVHEMNDCTPSVAQLAQEARKLARPRSSKPNRDNALATTNTIVRHGVATVT